MRDDGGERLGVYCREQQHDRCSIVCGCECHRAPRPVPVLVASAAVEDPVEAQRAVWRGQKQAQRARVGR